LKAVRRDSIYTSFESETITQRSFSKPCREATLFRRRVYINTASFSKLVFARHNSDQTEDQDFGELGLEQDYVSSNMGGDSSSFGEGNSVRSTESCLCRDL
jgi:hypothetical protein